MITQHDYWSFTQITKIHIISFMLCQEYLFRRNCINICKVYLTIDHYVILLQRHTLSTIISNLGVFNLPSPYSLFYFRHAFSPSFSFQGYILNDPIITQLHFRDLFGLSSFPHCSYIQSPIITFMFKKI